MTQLCHRMGISRQAHYQRLRRQMERQVDEEKILSQVRMVRRRHPCLGTRKLLVKLQPLMAQERLSIGRDRLFDLLRGRDLLVPPRRRRCRRTTWAGTRRAPNRVAGHSIDRPDAVWVADITYLDLAVGGQFVYLFVLMDLYSRYVVGWNLASSLAAEHALEALQEAICQAPRPLVGTIHHSDHGVQYTSTRYWNCLWEHGLQPSMGEAGNAYDNAYAERLLGTLKQEYALDSVFHHESEARMAVAQAIHFYNSDRPHTALDYATPKDVYYGAVVAPPVTVAKMGAQR